MPLEHILAFANIILSHHGNKNAFWSLQSKYFTSLIMLHQICSIKMSFCFSGWIVGGDKNLVVMCFIL
jgi:hypothetical protein